MDAARPIRLLVFLFLPVLAFGLARCGDQKSSEPAAGTPYGENPSGSDTNGTKPAGEQPPPPAAEQGRLDPALEKKAMDALAAGRKYLLAAQTDSGGWGIEGGEADAGVTGLAASALVAATPATAVGADEHVHAALAFLASQQKDDGSIFSNPRFVNYMTSAATGAFALARISEFQKNEIAARNYLASTQYHDDKSELSYGGFPYANEKEEEGEEEEPHVADLSNAQFAAQALHDAGLPKDSEVWKRMQVYLGRVQNRSESNDLKVPTEVAGQEVVVVAGDDGGAGYTPGTSKAGLVKRSDGTYEVRSYGSMTYALLKCLLLAGVDPKDGRVQGALGWISENFTLAKNPGFEASENPDVAGQQGYYYYLFTVARSLAAYERGTGQPLVVKDADGKEHHWRAELVQALLDRQQEDGSWVNDVDRWMESQPVLATSYALVALGEATGRFR